METLTYNISQVLGISILHSLWQGMVVYIIVRVVMAAKPSLSSVKKYNLAVSAMAVVSLWFAYMLVTEMSAFNWLKPTLVNTQPILPGLPFTGHVQPSLYQLISAYMPYICIFYILGLLANGLKLGWEWNKIRLIKRSMLQAEQMQQYINSLSKKLEISKKIWLKFSTLVDVPCVIGYIKPLILLPVSLSTSLSACEVESILLHELSHIKRNDYLVNLLQQAVSVVLFFNPFTHLINRLINRERENSCDDLVIEKTGKPLIYARALLKLEQERNNHLQLALAVTGNKFHLLNRIERIMKTQKQNGNIRHLFIGVLLLAGSISCLAWLNPTNAKSHAAKSNTSTQVATLASDSSTNAAVTDTAKHLRKAKATVKTKTAHKKVYHHVVKTDEFNMDSGDWSDSTAAYFRGPEWKAQMDAIKKQGEEMKKQFDSPEWKSQMEAMKSQAMAMQKQFDSPEWKAQQDAWKKQAVEMQKQFNSPEWKKQMDDIKKQGEQMRKQFDSPEWKKQMEDMKIQAEEMKKHYDSPEWKKQMEDMKIQGEEMKKQFESPEWKKQMKDISKMDEDMKKQFNSPEWKKQMKDMAKMGEDMSKQFNSPEWKKQMKDGKKYGKQKWILKDSVGGVDIYKPADKDTIK